MLKENRKLLIITSVIILLPIIVGLVLWNLIPDHVATHWGVENEANGWSSKGFTVFGIPLLMLALHWLCVFATIADPKKQNISSKIFGLVLWIVPLTTIFIYIPIYGIALGIAIDVGFICNILMGVLFIVLGNYLPKCKQNYSVGIKISWALNDEANWNATHRFAGWVWIIGGIIVLLCSPLANPTILSIVVVIMAFTPMAYSYLYYRRHR